MVETVYDGVMLLVQVLHFKHQMEINMIHQEMNQLRVVILIMEDKIKNFSESPEEFNTSTENNGDKIF